jgi:HTH-type transcriptional regulator/antitoxin HigA
VSTVYREGGGVNQDDALRTEAEYDAAVAEMDALLDTDPQPGTPEFARLERLSALVAAYDAVHHRMEGE